MPLMGINADGFNMFTVWKTFDKEAIFIKHIFRQYDIRGLVGKELSYELMQDIARLCRHGCAGGVYQHTGR